MSEPLSVSWEAFMKRKDILAISLAFIIPFFTFVGCDFMDLFEKLTEHEIIIEEDAYLRGTTSASGFVNLLDYEVWNENKERIKEITELKVEYRVTRNGSPTDIAVNFYFGENEPNIFLGSAELPQGQTNPDLVNLPLQESYHQLIELIMLKDAFWYSVQGNSENADVDFEPVRITVQGTFDIFE